MKLKEILLDKHISACFDFPDESISGKHLEALLPVLQLADEFKDCKIIILDKLDNTVCWMVQDEMKFKDTVELYSIFKSLKVTDEVGNVSSQFILRLKQ